MYGVGEVELWSGNEEVGGRMKGVYFEIDLEKSCYVGRDGSGLGMVEVGG